MIVVAVGLARKLMSVGICEPSAESLLGRNLKAARRFGSHKPTLEIRSCFGGLETHNRVSVFRFRATNDFVVVEDI